MPITADLKVQLGNEATNAWGTAVASTAALAGVQSIEISPIVDVQQVEEMCGTMTPSRQSLVHMVGGEASLTQLASYDNLGYWLRGMFGKVTATSDTGNDSDVWNHEYNAPFESSDVEDVISYTLVESDGANVYALNGATVNSLSLSGESGAPLEVSVEFIGMSVTTDTEDSLTCSTAVYIMGDHVQVFMDAGSDSFGGTSCSDVGWSFDMTINANRAVKRHLNDLSPTGYRHAKMTGTMSLSLEHDSDIEDHVDAIIGATTEGIPRNIRLQAEAGSSTNALIIDFAGVASGQPGIFQDVDGVVSADLEFMGQLNSGDTNWLTITLENTIETY